MKTQIVVRFQLPGLHCWDDATYPVEYLHDSHRHMFHFECKAVVSHDNRQLEFICLQKDIRNHLLKIYWNDHLGLLLFGQQSCEMVGKWLLEQFPVLSEVSVFEDGENGAVVTR